MLPVIRGRFAVNRSPEGFFDYTRRSLHPVRRHTAIQNTSQSASPKNP
jgi:hypothetical protein